MSHESTNTVIPGCGTHHLAVQALDLDVSLQFYRDVLGMPVVAEFGPPERRILLLAIGDGGHIELFAPPPGFTAPAEGAFPLMHIALRTSDARAATERVRAAGYTITTEPKDVLLDTIKATISFCKGPNGEVIEFFETT